MAQIAKSGARDHCARPTTWSICAATTDSKCRTRIVDNLVTGIAARGDTC